MEGNFPNVMKTRSNNPTALRRYKGLGREGWLLRVAVSRAYAHVWTFNHSCLTSRGGDLEKLSRDNKKRL